MNKNQKSVVRAKARQQQKGSSKLRTYSLMLVCAATLVCGFFFAARQHFSSMDFGMKNSRLRKQVDELEAEKRRLLLAREISLSPAEIKKAMKKTGLMAPAPLEGEVAQVISTTKEKAVPPQVSEAKAMVIKTVSVLPVQTASTASYSKTEKVTKQAKAKVSNN